MNVKYSRESFVDTAIRDRTREPFICFDTLLNLRVEAAAAFVGGTAMKFMDELVMADGDAGSSLISTRLFTDLLLRTSFGSCHTIQ